MSSPAHRVGILGAGQLALMLAQAARKLNVDVLCAGRPGDCAARAAGVIPVDLRDAASVSAFAQRVDLLTVESENIDAAVLRGLNLFPNERAIGIAQDRLLEKRFFEHCGIRVAPFASIDSIDDLNRALAHLGVPSILKTRRMGYDGKGQFRLTSHDQAETAWEANGSVPCILEGLVSFEAEVSLIAARNASGDSVFYPLIENQHRDGILRKSIVPCRYQPLQQQAEQHVTRLLDELNYIGVLAVEFFVLADTLIANEMAPRVHNSGHWTVEGAATSQFENHLRAILNLPLGDTVSRPMVMLNCIGVMPSLSQTVRFSEIFRHDYGKAPRPGRKVGHLTIPASAGEAIATWEQTLGSAS